MTARLRLIQVVVQPIVMLDDGNELAAVEHPPIVIPASEWPTYSSERFPREMKDWQAKLDAEVAAGAGKPNRATRRTKPRRKNP